MPPETLETALRQRLPTLYLPLFDFGERRAAIGLLADGDELLLSVCSMGPAVPDLSPTSPRVSMTATTRMLAALASGLSAGIVAANWPGAVTEIDVSIADPVGRLWVNGLQMTVSHAKSSPTSTWTSGEEASKSCCERDTAGSFC